MQEALADIQTGRFAKNWLLENQVGRPQFNALKRRNREHLIEEVGEKLRAMMPWLKETK
jgi:ketol-acid reductoisomerase